MRFDVNKIAEENGWLLRPKKKRSCCTATLVYDRNDEVIIVNVISWSVTTFVNHPSWGRTYMTRKKCNKRLLKQIFENPRVHSGKGLKIYKVNSLSK